MTHISHSGVQACVETHTLAYSIGGGRCDVPDGKTLGLINASKPILGSYSSLSFFLLLAAQLKHLIKDVIIRKHL